MATYAFETITAAQALALTATDGLTLPGGSSARTATVLYLPDDLNSMMIGGRVVVFGAAFRDIAAQLAFPDGSRLYVGSPQGDVQNFFSTNASGAIYGGDGDDSLTSGDGQWLVQGNQGNDVIYVRLDRLNTVYGGQGNDNIQAGYSSPGGVAVSQFIQGNKGNDTVLGTGSTDTILGGQGNDLISGSGGQDFINGNLGDDSLQGSGRIFGEGGNDLIYTYNNDELTFASGDEGNDTLIGRAGADTLTGGSGDDSIDGGAGNNSLDGGDGADAVIMRQYSGDNTIDGGEGNDSVHGGYGNDVVSGGAGNDQVVDMGGTANRLDAGDGNDAIFITAGSGVVLCGAGNDTLDAVNATTYSIDGGAGNDLIRGSGRGDIILGGDGDDTIDDGGGIDTIYGGSGQDHFQFFTGAGNDFAPARTPRIVDWSSEDRIQLHTPFPGQPSAYEERSASSFEAAVTLANERLHASSIKAIVSIQVGGDVIVFSGLSGGSSIYKAVLLSGRSLSDLSGDNFIF